LDIGSTPRLDLSRSVTATGEVVLTVGGELDVATVDQLDLAFELTLDLALAQPGVARTVVDLGNLRFLDSTGIAHLISAHTEAAARGTTLVVVNSHGMVRRVLELTGVFATLTGDGR
jgi:anti-anti-sigma factor